MKERRGNEKKIMKEGKEKMKPIITHALRVQGPERTRSLFVGTISLMICPGDVPTEGRHDETRRKATRGGRDTELEQNKSKHKTEPAFPCPAGGTRNRQETQGKAETEITKTKET